MSAPRSGLGAGGRLGLCWQSRDVRIQTSCHNIQIKHRSRQPPCEAEARRRPAEAEAGRQQPLPVPAKPPRWHGDADGGRLFESDDPPPPRPRVSSGGTARASSFQKKNKAKWQQGKRPERRNIPSNIPLETSDAANRCFLRGGEDARARGGTPDVPPGLRSVGNGSGG